ncbi:MAG: C1 family peptidase, partial [Thermodesulfobacteriota bacterium]|nr:C1 family peptidase [Thermodesulfobacteriota bacterium]
MTKSIVKVCLALSAALLLFTILSPYSPARTEKILKFESGDTLEEIRYKIAHNGYNFTVGENWVTRLSPEERDRLLNRHYPLSPRRRNAHDEIGPLVKHLGKKLPSSLDWRNYNGHAYIGPIQNQGSCGSCYAFGAAAAAEGTYNWATGKYDGNRADLSEAFIAFCLSDHYSGFDGCNGANYDYEELQALVDYGICTEAQYPYTDYEQACPLSPYPPLTQFQSWHRIPCNDIDAIKTAIMTYGVVDAAVQAGSAWLGYSGGIYQDSNTSCYEDPCYYTPTNHAISLVGWDDNPPEGGGGVWILRNSHGTSFGESGYMRIRYTSAYVSCEACYMVFSAPPPPYPTIIDEGFDDFQNGTRPSGWTFTDCNQNSDTYIAPESYYGAALPSLKLNASSATIITETFSNPRLLTFWIRGVETGGDAGSLLVEEFYGGGWTTVTDLTSLPLEAATSGPYPLYTDTTQLRFNFTQNIGNLAFDDVKVYQGTTPTPTLTPRTPTPTATPTVTPTPSLTPYGWKTPSPTVTPTPFGEIPFTEDFEGIWASGVPAGWSKEYITGTTDWVRGIGCDDGGGKPPAAHGGSYNALFYYDDAVTKVTRLITPRLIFGSKTQNTQLTFWHAQGDWDGDFDTLKVYYKTSAGGSWTLLQSYTAAVDTWTERTISLPNPGDDYYLCFEGTTNWGWGVCVDDVSITGESTGPTPPPPTP